LKKYLNIEYLIIDGCSSDNTISIIKRYENLFEGRLNTFQREDSGIYDAWNKEWKSSR
jgi:glycosyltransferase involved in cell wall biosynthesis